MKTPKARAPRAPRRRRKQLPVVLIVDDVEEQANAAKQSLREHVDAIARSPNDVTDCDLDRANLVLVDLQIDDWPERNGLLTPSLRPRNGIALTATLRSNLSPAPARTPTAFALHSGQLDKVSGNRPAQGREHAIAKMWDTEWVFAKGAPPHEFAAKVTCLASAVLALPHPWPAAGAVPEALRRLLGLKKKGGWRLRAFEDVQRANPPQDTFAHATHGIAFIRWLLQDILPFPTFLLEERYVAARLHVTPASLRTALNSTGQNKLREQLDDFRYRGVLEDFAGVRWWRAGLEQWLWAQTDGRPFDSEVVRKLTRRLSTALRAAKFANPGVELDEQFRPTDNAIDLDLAVQLTPDDWPALADAAWVTIDRIRENPELAERVAVQDRERLGLNGG